jgi:hypothetical protein
MLRITVTLTIPFLIESPPDRNIYIRIEVETSVDCLKFRPKFITEQLINAILIRTMERRDFPK